MGFVVSEPEITGSQIEAQYQVDPDAGSVRRLSRGGNWLDAGWKTWNGYQIVSFPLAYRKYKKVRIHHLVWAWVYGCWPTGEIDHINSDRSDNRIENLREATVAQNRTNKAIQSNNKSGYKWVTYHPGSRKWRTEVTYRENGIKKRYRVLHSSAEAAYADACNFAATVHGEFYNSGKVGGNHR